MTDKQFRFARTSQCYCLGQRENACSKANCTQLSLKKRHRLYVTLMTDLSDPTRPQILAVERGRDTTATLKCLDRLTQEQRQQVRTHRVDMGPAYPAACA